MNKNCKKIYVFYTSNEYDLIDKFKILKKQYQYFFKVKFALNNFTIIASIKQTKKTYEKNYLIIITH